MRHHSRNRKPSRLANNCACGARTYLAFGRDWPIMTCVLVYAMRVTCCLLSLDIFEILSVARSSVVMALYSCC